MNEILSILFGYGIPIATVLVLIVIGLFSTGFALEGEGRWNKYALPFVFALMLGAMALGTVFSGRNVSAVGIELFAISEASSASSIGSWLLRMSTFLIILVCSVRTFSTLYRGDFRDIPREPLYVAFLAFFLSNSVTNALWGTQPAFIHGIYYSGLLFTLIHASRNQDPILTLRVVRSALLLFMLASCLAAVVLPDITIQRNYLGAIPGLSVRFWGLGSNPNSIGPMAAIAVLLLRYVPCSQTWVQRSSFALCFLVLLLSQSKTAWGSLLIAYATQSIYQRYAASTHQSRNTGWLALFALLLLASGSLIGVLAYIDVAARFDDLLRSQSGLEAITLTGRVDLWRVAVETWWVNPWFGYGLKMWDIEHRMLLHMPHAFSAHNQFLQSLGQAGLLGLAGLLFYVSTMCRYAWRLSDSTDGLSLGLLAFVLVRTISETPLKTDTLLNGDLYTHALLFYILIAFSFSQIKKDQTVNQPAQAHKQRLIFRMES